MADGSAMSAAARAAAHLGDRRWRLNNLYTVETEGGEIVQFGMNAAQEAFFGAAHCLNVILKARQLGFTTFVCLLMLDAALFNSGTRCGVIAHTRDDAGRIYKDKIRSVYERLPDWLRAAVPATEDSAQQLSFANGSTIRVGTSLRGGTFQWLLVSEYGKICAKYPDKAKEIRTGALNTVHAGNVIVVESTAEGADGDFYEMVERAKALQETRAALTPLDFKLHFAPWWGDQRYRLDAGGVTISPALRKYFDDLRAKHGIDLNDQQQAWYAKKRETQGEEMAREYPSHPGEAFHTAIDGAFFAAEMRALREGGRIRRALYDPQLPVHTAWDLGLDDYTAVWFAQVHQREVRLIEYREWTDTSLIEILRQMSLKPYQWGYDICPHDIRVRDYGTGTVRLEHFERGGRRVLIAPGPSEITLADGIDKARLLFTRCYFDEEGCADGLKRLAGYRKEWSDKLGVWLPKPRKDGNDHGADAFRYLSLRADDLQDHTGRAGYEQWSAASRRLA